MKISTRRIPELFSLLFIFIWLYLIAMRGVGLYDDNAIYSPAIKVAHGQILYKEAYTQYGPIMVYIQAAFIKIFGERMWSVRLSAILFYIIAICLYYYIFKKYLPYWFVLISAIILILLEPSGYGVFHSWSSIYALVFELLLIIIFINYIKTHKYRYVILSGLVAGIIFFCRQTTGIVFIIGTLMLWIILGMLLKENIIKNIAGAALGIIIVIGQGALYFYINGCLIKWIEEALINQFGLLSHFMNKYCVTGDVISEISANQLVMGSSSINKAIGVLKCLFPIQLIGLYFLLPFLLFADLIYYLYRIKTKKINEKNIEIFIVTFICVISWHQYFPIEGDLLHTYWAAFPMIGLLAINIYEISKKLFKKKIGFIACVMLFLLTSPTLFNRVSHSVDSIKNHNITSEECKWTDGIKLSEDENQFFVDYYDYINCLREQYDDLLIYNYTSLYLPECEITNNNNSSSVSAILYIRKEGQYRQLDKYISFTDSFPMECEIFMELVVNEELLDN